MLKSDIDSFHQSRVRGHSNPPSNITIHLSRLHAGLYNVLTLCGQVIVSVGQIRRLADGRTKLSHQRPVD
jgi:hypothetical protein